MPPTKPPVAWLPETFAWRLVPLTVPLLGLLVDKEPLPTLDEVFLALWLLFSVVDGIALALTRSLVLHGMLRWRLSGWWLLLALASVPVVGFLLSTPALVAFSPSAALLCLGWQPLLQGHTTSWAPATRVSATVATLLLFARLALLILAWRWSKGMTPLLARHLPFLSLLRSVLWFAWRVGEIAFVVPALEKWLLKRVENPVFRHFVRVTRWRFGWLPYMLAFVVGVLLPANFVSWAAIALLTLSIPFLAMFYFASYTAVHAYLRKLHQTGELWQWLITPLPTRSILNGWYWSGWWWQVRRLALFWWLVTGASVKNAGVFLSAPIWLLVVSALGVCAFLAISMGAVPVALYDAFREPQQMFSAEGRRWSYLKATVLAFLVHLIGCSAVVTCGSSLLIFALATMGAVWDPPVRALERVRRAPMEHLPLR